MDRPPNQNQLLDGQVLESSEEQEQEGGEQATARSLTGRPPIILYLSFDHGAFPPFQLLVRRNIEFFEALPIDVETSVQGRPRPILLGQVGLRCIFCASLQPSIRRKLVHNQNETKTVKLDSTVVSHILGGSSQRSGLHAILKSVLESIKRRRTLPIFIGKRSVLWCHLICDNSLHKRKRERRVIGQASSFG